MHWLLSLSWWVLDFKTTDWMTACLVLNFYFILKRTCVTSQIVQSLIREMYFFSTADALFHWEATEYNIIQCGAETSTQILTVCEVDSLIKWEFIFMKVNETLWSKVRAPIFVKVRLHAGTPFSLHLSKCLSKVREVQCSAMNFLSFSFKINLKRHLSKMTAT